MDARTGRRQKKISSRQEKFTAQDVGGRMMPASGAMPNAGADVRKMGELRIECKYTDKDFYSLELLILEKVKLQAIKGGLEAPVLQLGFRNHLGHQELYCIIPWDPNQPRPAFRIVTTNKSTRLYKDQLNLALVNGKKLVVAFEEKKPFQEFEILRWEEYLDRINNAAY